MLNHFQDKSTDLLSVFSVSGGSGCGWMITLSGKTGSVSFEPCKSYVTPGGTFIIRFQGDGRNEKGHEGA